MSVLYCDYKTWAENCKFTAYNKSQFEERLLTDETGIIKCIYDGLKSYRINKDKFIDYLNKHRGEDAENLEVIEKENFNQFEEDE